MRHLKEQIHIGQLVLKNRLVMAPVATERTLGDGKVTDRHVAFYDDKTQNGQFGLVIVEHSYISEEGKASPKQLSVATDDVVPGLETIARTIQKNGSKAVLQISHAGSAASMDITGQEPVGPSAVPNPRKGGIPTALTEEEIREIVNKFARSAVRAKDAGFDGVEIHSAHGYFLNQFYSPLTNTREDGYGGSVENRVRIHLEIIEAVKEAVGPQYPVLLRLGASDYTQGGASVDDAVTAAGMFEKAGIVLLDVSGGFCGYKKEDSDCPGYFSDASMPLKLALKIPVILTGGITEIEQAESLLKEDKADLIGVARAILKDSSWASNL